MISKRILERKLVSEMKTREGFHFNPSKLQRKASLFPHRLNAAQFEITNRDSDQALF